MGISGCREQKNHLNAQTVKEGIGMKINYKAVVISLIVLLAVAFGYIGYQEFQKNEDQTIILSQFTQALLDAIKSVKPKAKPDDISALSVSQTVSFFALVYEKVRNAVEYRDDHLILRAAIERILKRRFSLNPDGRGEAENLLRELLWARYYENNTLGEEKISQVQTIADKYFFLRNELCAGRN